MNSTIDIIIAILGCGVGIYLMSLGKTTRRTLTTEQFFNNFLRSELHLKQLVALINEYGGVKMFIGKTKFMNELIDRDFEFYQHCYNFMDIEYEILRKTQMSHIEIVNQIVSLSKIKVIDDDVIVNIEEVRAFGTYIFFWVNKEEFEKELKGALRNIGLFGEKLKP